MVQERPYIIYDDDTRCRQPSKTLFELPRPRPPGPVWSWPVQPEIQHMQRANQYHAVTSNGVREAILQLDDDEAAMLSLREAMVDDDANNSMWASRPRSGVWPPGRGPWGA